MNKNSYCVIMAGGVGKRFWPLSTKQHPKQFCDIMDIGKSFLQQTYERACNIFSPENIFVITGVSYATITAEQLPELPPENILMEPFGKNTAPCVAYAAYKIASINPDAIMVVVPSDHLITNDNLYCKNINTGISFVDQSGGLLTIGIKPTRPETGYGYIQIKKNGITGSISKVKTFTEKPDIDLAKIFLESGDFLWNAGIFIWRVTDIINEFKKYLEDIYFLFEKEYKNAPNPDSQENLKLIYSQCSSVSIDYGILERSSKVYVIKGDFGWSDIGTWRAYYELSEKDKDGNVTNSKNIMLLDSSKCIVNVPKGRKIIIQGLNECIVAERDDIIMICKRQCSSNIRNYEELLKAHLREEEDFGSGS